MEGVKKISYSIGQVSEMTGLAQSTIRYWETVFDILSPSKTEGGSRRYREKDIELIIKIKKLLHYKGFTIKGAKVVLNDLQEKETLMAKTHKTEEPAYKSEPENKDLEKFKNEIVSELIRIKSLLE